MAPSPTDPSPGSSAADAPASPPPPPSRKKVFLARLGSTLGLWAAIVVAFLLHNEWVYFGIVVGLTILALIEYFHMLGTRNATALRNMAIVISAGYLITGFLMGRPAGESIPLALDGAAIALMILATFLLQLRHAVDGRQTLMEVAGAITGFVYITILFAFSAKILFGPWTDAQGASTGVFYVIYFLAVTKFTDAGAYVVGSLIGKHKMIPHISPGKTWQGFFGAIVVAYLIGYGVLALFPGKLDLIQGWPAAVFPLVLALVAVLGDLAESILKRSLQIKDSGHVMPGIGGILDLLDSILFTAPVFYYALYLLSSA